MNKLVTYVAVCAVAFSVTTIAQATGKGTCPLDLIPGMKNQRMLEALQIAKDGSAKVHRSLDDVMDSTGKGDGGFDLGIAYMISVQHDPNNMNINIDGVISRNSSNNAPDGFEYNWGNATKPVYYRKRIEGDWLIDESTFVDDENCLRSATFYSTGLNYIITNTVAANATATTPQLNTAQFVTDRFTVTLQEVTPEAGHNCNFNFRIVSIGQFTEARFPLPPVPVPASQLAIPIPPATSLAPIFGVVSSPVYPNTMNTAEYQLVPCLNN